MYINIVDPVGTAHEAKEEESRKCYVRLEEYISVPQCASARTNCAAYESES